MQASSDDGQPWLADNWTLAGSFVRDVAHDVNNQLGAVLAYAELIALDAGNEPELRGMVNEISTAVHRASLLMDTLASISSRDLTSVQPVDLCVVVRDALVLFEREVDRRHVRLDVQLPQAPATFMGVHTRIARLVVHAIRYAMDRVDGKSAELRIKLFPEQDCFRLVITTAANVGRGDGFQVLAEAEEHATYHGGSVAQNPGPLTITIPRDTGLS